MPNHIISIFTDIREVKNPYHKDVVVIFKRIREDYASELIALIRAEEDEEKRRVLKGKLPSICFSGTFSQRNDDFLIEHSGLICLDVDKMNVDELIEVKNSICQNDYVFACFISPSGNGLKIIVRIPPVQESHRDHFRALKNYFDQILSPYYIDPSGINISRVCYQSCDSEIYYNENSQVWVEIEEEKTIEIKTEEHEVLTDDDKIIDNLQTWINLKMPFVKGQRNNHVFVFACAMCRFGIEKTTAFSYFYSRYAGFPEKSLHTTIDSAYKKNQSAFGSQKFEHIASFTKTIPKSNQVSEFDNETKEDGPVNVFWYLGSKGKICIDTIKLLKFIHANGFGVYRCPENPKKFQFIHVKNMIVSIVGNIDIKICVMDFVRKNTDNESVFDELQMKNRYFEDSFLNALPVIDVKPVKDTKDKSFVFFSDFYYEITKNKITKKDYIDLDGLHIWKNQICHWDVTELVDYKEFDFNVFIFNAVGKSSDKYLSVCSALGYGLHTYKDVLHPKMPYFCEEASGELDGMACGGSGKSLIQKSMRYIRSVVEIDGRNYRDEDQFKMSLVQDDTQVIIMEDFDADIDKLFVMATGSFSKTNKGVDTRVYDFEDSPKIFFNSNKVPKGFSASYARRMHIVQFSNFYNETHTPANDFEKAFFIDWDQADKNKFFSLMFDCVQLYLNKGLIGSEADNIREKQLVRNCGLDFAEFFTNTYSIDFNDWQMGRVVFTDYIDVTHDNINEQKFYGFLRKMAKIFAWEYESRGVGMNRQIKIHGYDFHLNHRKII